MDRQASPALLTLQQTPVSGDLSLQFHLGIQELVVALTLSGQAHPHLIQLSLQAADHLGEVLQSAGVQLLSVPQGGLQAFLLNREDRMSDNGWSPALKLNLNRVTTFSKLKTVWDIINK